MSDIYPAGKRSDIMRAIKSKDTKVEKIVFKYLNSQKLYYQKHYSRALGKPDIALPRKKRAVFLDGDFWHGKKYDQILRNRPAGDYWVTKIARNMERDKRQRQQLSEDGWSVLAIWESDILKKKTQSEALELIKDFLVKGSL